MNKAEEGGIVATGAGSVFSNKAAEGGIVNTGAGSVATQEVKDGGQVGTTNLQQNDNKYAATNSTQTVNEIKAEEGGIAAVGNVMTLDAKEGGIAAAPGSAVSKIDLQGSVEHNNISFDVSHVSTETKSGNATSEKAKSGSAYDRQGAVRQCVVRRGEDRLCVRPSLSSPAMLRPARRKPNRRGMPLVWWEPLRRRSLSQVTRVRRRSVERRRCPLRSR